MKIGETLYRRNIFNELVAMEAGEPEDITATTDDMMKRAGGANADTGEMNPSRTSEETQQANGGNVDRDAMSGNTDGLNPDPNAGGTDDTGMGDMDDLGGGGDMGGEGGGDMGGGMEPQEDQAPPESPEQAEQILKLQKNMTTFYRILSNTLDTLNGYSAPATTPELRKIYNAGVSHLTSAKEMMTDLVSTDITSANYPDKLRKYITLRHVYSAVVEMLTLHFQVLEEGQSGSSKTGSGK
jgi:hypothetical protein